MTDTPLAVTNVSSQLKMQPTTSATVITAIACINEESRSDIPNWRTFAVVVMIAVV